MLNIETPRLQSAEARRATDEAASISHTALTSIRQGHRMAAPTRERASPSLHQSSTRPSQRWPTTHTNTHQAVGRTSPHG